MRTSTKKEATRRERRGRARKGREHGGEITRNIGLRTSSLLIDRGKNAIEGDRLSQKTSDSFVHVTTRNQCLLVIMKRVSCQSEESDGENGKKERKECRDMRNEDRRKRKQEHTKGVDDEGIRSDGVKQGKFVIYLTLQ